MKKTIIYIFFALSVLALDAQEIPLKISYQGKLLENGLPVTGTKSMIFIINSWSETQNVEITEGLYSVILGSVNSIPVSLFENSSTVELQISVEGQTLEPNTEILSVAYSYIAAKAEDSKKWDGNEYPGGIIWTSENDGVGSGLDADMIDGLNSTSFVTNPYPDVLTANGFYTSDTSTAGFMAESNNISNGFYAKEITDGRGFFAIDCETGIGVKDCHTGVSILNGSGYGIKSYGNTWTGIRSTNNDENGFESRNNIQWGFYAQGNNSGGYGGQSKGRCVNIISETSSEATASFHNNSDKSRGVFIEGDVHSTGGYSLSINNEDNNELIAFPIISIEKEIIISGTSVLENGQQEIQFNNCYSSALDNCKEIVVILTPLENVNGFLIVNNKTNKGFDVQLNEIPGLEGNVNTKFDWLVIAKIQNAFSKEETSKYIESERQAKIKMIEEQKDDVGKEENLKLK